MNGHIHTEILLEIALRVGASTDIDTTLREAVTTMLRLLNCNGAQVLQAVTHEGGEALTWKPVLSLPRPLARDAALAAFVKRSRLPAAAGRRPAWAQRLPRIEPDGAVTRMLFDLPAFGALVLVRYGSSFDPQFLRSLQQLLDRLGQAAASCVAAAERERAEAERERAEAERESLRRTVEAVAALFLELGPDSRKNMDRLVRGACELTGGAASLYNRLDDAGRSLVVWSGHQLPPDLPGSDAPHGHICYEATIRGQDQTVVLGNLEGTEYERTDAAVSKYGLKAYLGHPVHLRGKAIGALAVVDGKPRDFTAAEIGAIQMLARALSLEEERAWAEQRVTHLNRVLAAIRDINQLIVRESERGRLLSGACRLLVETRGFENALIVPVADGAPAGPFYQAYRAADGAIAEGPDAALAAQLAAGFVPECGRRCLAAEGVHPVLDTTAQCGACPQAQAPWSRGDLSVMSTRLAHEGRVFGWLAVAVPAAYAQETEDAGLLREVADDLAYALRNQERAAEERRAHERLDTVVNSLDAFVYIADMSTHEILFVNDYARRLVGEVVGRRCWEALQQGQAGPCAFCTNDKLLDAEGRPAGVHAWEFENPRTGRWYDCRDMAVRWTDGRLVRMEIATDITERKRAEENLSQERERLAGIIRGTNAGTWEWNVQTGETILNERWAEIIGYTLDELSPVSIETWMKFTHPDDLKTSDELLRKHFSGELDYYECEARMRHKSGEWVWVLDRGRVTTWTDDGKPLMMMGTHQDITARKRAEAILAESERRLHTLFQYTPSMAVQGYNSRREVIFWNRASEEFYGYSEAQALGRQLEDLIIPEAMREGVIAAVAAWVAGGPTIPAAPLVLKRADGSGIPVFSSHLMTRNARGEPEMYCIDISLVEQRRLEAELAAARQAEEEDRFARLFRDNPTPMAIAELPDRRFVEVNAAFLAASGYAREEILGATSASLGAFADESELAAFGALLQTGKPVRNFEARLRRKDGSVLSALISCDHFPFAGREGLLYALTDITAQKEVEAKLAESEAAHRKMLDTVQAGIVVINPDSHVVEYVNPAAARMFGGAPGDMTGQRCHRFLCPAEDGQCPVTDLGQLVDNAERTMLRSDGTPRSVLKSAGRIELGGKPRLIESFIDITERK